MPQGNTDLLILLIIFLALQSWWIYPIIKTKRNFKKKTTSLQEKIDTLEKLYKR